MLDDISKLTTPATELPDLEDDNFEDSQSALKSLKSTGNRQKAAQNFNFEEGKYAGSAVSRKELFGDISEISGLQGNFDKSESEEDEDEEEKIDNFDESEPEIEDEEENEDLEDEEDENPEEIDTNMGMTTLSLKDEEDKADKAASVRNQRLVWDDLLYSNIRLHALLNTANQLPRGEARKNLLKTSEEHTQKSMESAMENMGKLRNLMKNAMELIGEGKGKAAGEDEEDDDDVEEIPSDEEILSDFEDDEEEPAEELEIPGKSRKIGGGSTSVKSLAKNLQKIDEKMEKFRATTLTKWYNRTKILNTPKSMNNTDFSVFEKGSILGQINKVLADEEKLLKKVRTNRSGKPRIGGKSDSPESLDPETFDDSDFYQILLKQMLEARNQMSNNSQDGADMTRSYMELQTMFSNKKKRDVSQLSSKDRRLKYEPIARLINFYPSKPSVVTWSHESRNELFKSLFS